jgi:hypothetical protein
MELDVQWHLIMLHVKLEVSFSLLFAVALSLSPSADAAAISETANPGTLNYLEGVASIGSQVLDSKSVGSTQLKAGQFLTTGEGKAEVLLTPGVFLRLDSNSSIEMISPGLTKTEVSLEKGRATVEVAEIHPQNDLRIDEDVGNIHLLKDGFYDFDADEGQVRVFAGNAIVHLEDQRVKVKGGREVSLDSAATAKARKFNKEAFDRDDLYRWSSLRSAYLAEANEDEAPDYAMRAGFIDGWYWDPWFGCYTFIPGDGIFYSPFGWGFYSPWLVDEDPFFNYGHHNRHFDRDARNWGPGPHYGPGVIGSRVYRGGGFAGSRGGGLLGGGGFHGSSGFHARGRARGGGGGGRR